MSGDGSRGYEFRIEGHLDDRWTACFDGFDIEPRTDGTSTLTGSLADQAQLHGVLARLRDIGATLLGCRALDDRSGDPLSPPEAAAGTSEAG